MAASVQDIPKSLAYEMVDGQPIYYKGYRAYLIYPILKSLQEDCPPPVCLQQSLSLLSFRWTDGFPDLFYHFPEEV